MTAQLDLFGSVSALSAATGPADDATIGHEPRSNRDTSKTSAPATTAPDPHTQGNATEERHGPGFPEGIGEPTKDKRTKKAAGPVLSHAESPQQCGISARWESLPVVAARLGISHAEAAGRLERGRIHGLVEAAVYGETGLVVYRLRDLRWRRRR